MKILLLEDEHMLRTSIEEYLIAFNHKIVGFTNGEDALKNLENNIYDLLVLDINVPKLNGLELLKELKEQDIVTPTIFISANLDIEDISEAFDLGACDYLKKPFHLKELGIRIERIKKEQKIKSSQHMVLSSKYYFSKEEKILFYNNVSQVLTKKQLQILTLLCENIGVIVDFEKFRSFVWNDEPVDNATIRAEISRFRKSLKEDFISNIKGVGYRIDKYYSH
ncbi:response regulator transcription factor [Sulfurospirillum arcachonense]|uniref:response regulator transcription factor n=1 Tax=Sulfurospirillum arcachonense TaxID=57666 RepID=UPI000469CB57|nr:response regulator transcription factor [Sulfurospirillum arcachonense]